MKILKVIITIGIFSIFCNCSKWVEDIDDFYVENPIEVDYIIKNEIHEKVDIIVKDGYYSDKTYCFSILPNDSIIRNGSYCLFNGNFYVLIADSIKFQCDIESGKYNIGVFSSYDTIEVGDNYYKMRYVIDEDFYEYAKSHAYKE